VTWLARLSLTNRAIVGLVTVLAVVFGVISTFSLRQELFPSLDLPVATIITAYPRASPEVMEKQITTPIEAVVDGITGVKNTHSTTTGGFSTVIVDLEYGSDLTELTSQLQRAVQGLSLPTGATPKVLTGGTDSIPVAQLAVSSNLNADRIAAVLRDQVRPLLAGLDGVADVRLSGIRDPQITIDVDTTAAAAHGISLSSVLALLQANGVRVPAGQLTPDTNPLTVEVGSPITSIEALKDLYLVSAPVAAPSASTGPAAVTAPRGSVQPVTLLDPARPAGTVHAVVLFVTAVPSGSAQLRPNPTPKSTASASPRPTATPKVTTSAEPRSAAAFTPTSSPSPRPTVTPKAAGIVPAHPAAIPVPTSRVRLPSTVPPGGSTLPRRGGTDQPLTGPLLTAGVPPTGGTPVRLGDIATITAAPAPATGYTRTNGVPSIGIGVTKKALANTVAVSDEVRGALPRITEMLGGAAESAKVTVVLDQAPFIRQSVDDLTTEGLLGLVFAVVVILGFLLSLRATLVTAVSIPLSVLIAMMVLDLGGYTLNILTLGALTVAIGRVVDDSIVVIENIKRHIGYGGPRRMAIMRAVREVAGAITASTVTTVAVFAPIGLVHGQVGELFRPFAVTVTAALLASLLVSLTVVPVLSSVVLRRSVDPTPQPPAPDHDDPPPQRTWLQRGYLPLLRGALRRPVISLLIAVGILAGTIALAPALRTNFLGNAGGDTLLISQELAPGTGLPQADSAAKRVEGVLAATPGVASYQVTVGSPEGGGFRFGQVSGVTRFLVTLAAKADATAVADDLRARLSALSRSEQVGRLTVQGGQDGFGNETLLVSVRAADPAVLAQAAGTVQQAVESIPGAADVRNNLVAAQPTVEVTVDRQKAAQSGLTEAQIGQSVATALCGSTAGTLTIGGVEQTVVVRSGVAPGDLAALRALPLTTARGTVPLSDVATVTQSSTTPSISHSDGARSAEITARPAADDLGAVTTALTDKLNALALPAGATARIGGVSAEQTDAFAQLEWALLVAIAVVYLVMVVTFRSLVQPLLLLVAIPFAATGALGLMLLTDTPLGVPALIGMLMLIGIVVTNAIVLIDLVNQYRLSGREVLEAVVEGTAQRLRPILMTAVATVCALLPMALGLTGGGVFISQPLAIVVIGGLISSTLLTLVLVPVLYVLTARARGRAAAVNAAADETVASQVVAPTLTLPAIESSSEQDSEQARELTRGWVAASAEPVPGELPFEEPANLSGEVRSPSGVGVAALVALVNLRGEVVAGARADGQGGYRLTHVPAGEHYLLVSPPAGESTTQPVALPTSGNVHLDVMLPDVMLPAVEAETDAEANVAPEEAESNYHGQHRSEDR
jgi:hydrophobic/amphiphilic exporter-1 (mainly G- bacteria), HAE1 family